MAFVKAAKVNGKLLNDWPQVERALNGLDTDVFNGTNRNVFLTGPNDDLVMTITADKRYGFTVSCVIENDTLWFAAVDPTKDGEEDVDANVGGQIVDIKRCLLVPKASAIAAARAYYESGTLNPDVPWVYADDVDDIDFSKTSYPYTKLWKPDTALANVIGAELRSRARAHEDAIGYLRTHGLIIQKGKIYANCDDKTKPLFAVGQSQFSFEDLRQAVNKHLLPQ